MKPSLLIALIIGILLGLFIAYIDTRPHWNDDGISVLMVLIASFICATISSQKTWLVALSIGIWVPVFNIALAHNYGSLLALVPAFIGAYAGLLSRRIFSKS